MSTEQSSAVIVALLFATVGAFAQDPPTGADGASAQDASASQTLLRDQAPPASGQQQMSSADRELSLMDADGDGVLSDAEHTAGAKRMFASMDADQDGVVTAREMEQIAQSMPTSASDRDTLSAQAKIKAVDRNADGKLSAQEHAVSSREMFGKMDANSDGRLSRDEIQMAHDEMMTTERPNQKPQ